MKFGIIFTSGLVIATTLFFLTKTIDNQKPVTSVFIESTETLTIESTSPPPLPPEKEGEISATTPSSSSLTALTANKPIVPQPNTSKTAVVQKTPIVPLVAPFSAPELINEIHRLTNVARSDSGRPSYTFDNALATYATTRSQDMAKRNYLSHTSKNGCDISCHFSNSSYNSLVWGENLADYSPYDFLSTEELAAHFVKEWLQSSGHKKNLLSKEFTSQGIGVAIEAERIVVTVIFSDPE